MKETTIDLHTRFQVGAVDSRLFGGFLEHMGRAVYEGVYDPASRHADERGCRRDVLDALRRLDLTAMRYPGGNFASGYHWQDGVGPRENRPQVRDLAWKSIETNHFGTDEYIALCRTMNWLPMLTVNLGTGTPEEARNWVEYCNGPSGTQYADLRAGNGSETPYGVTLWCLGNEMDGPWQLGHVPAREYAIRAQQAAKMMKDADKSIEVVVCGSCGVSMPSYMEWDREVLEYVGDLADYVSLHRYVGNRENDTAGFLGVTNSVDRQIEEMDSACRFIQAKRRSKRRVRLCFDEWNVWYRNSQMDGEGKRAPHLVEEVYNLEDALVVAGFFHSFIRHADAVKIANLAQVVNVIAPVLTCGDDMMIQTIFYPFEMFSKRRAGCSLRVGLEGPAYEAGAHGLVPFIDSSAILDGRQLRVFLTNRDTQDRAEVRIRVADQEVQSVEEAEILTGPDAKAANSFVQKTVVRTEQFTGATVRTGQVTVEMPPLSFAAMPLEKPEDFGTDAGGGKNAEYCRYCFQEGAFSASCGRGCARRSCRGPRRSASWRGAGCCRLGPARIQAGAISPLLLAVSRCRGRCASAAAVSLYHRQ